MISIPGYHVIGLLAKGGMSKVYLARDLERRRKVAIKVYQSKMANTDVARVFQEETRILAELHHINIVSIYDQGELEDGRLYLTMDYIEGGNLRHRMSSSSDELMAVGTLLELAYILHYVHNHGIIHCDIKPANILFRRDDSLVLTDFGIAKHLTHHSCREKSSMVMVSPDYASPEQIQGLPFDHRTDIYSAGVIFVEMLTGKNPYRGSNLDKTLQNHLRMKTPQLNEHLSHFQPLVDRLLAQSPDDRFDSMHQCVDCANGILANMAEETITEHETVYEEVPVLTEMDILDSVYETTLLRAAGI